MFKIQIFFEIREQKQDSTKMQKTTVLRKSLPRGSEGFFFASFLLAGLLFSFFFEIRENVQNPGFVSKSGKNPDFTKMFKIRES